MKITETITEAITGKTVELTVQDLINISSLTNNIDKLLAKSTERTFIKQDDKEDLLKKCVVFFNQLTLNVTSLEDSYNSLFTIKEDTNQ